MQDAASRILISGASVVTMDDGVPDLPVGDVLIEDGRIAAVGPRLAAEGAQIIAGRGRIVIPGLVNAHMHTWQTGLRGLAANWTLPEYFRQVHAGLATRFGPADIGIATLVGALNQLNCGTTTLGDWCHNNPTPAHTDAAVAALRQSGIRAVFLHGSPKPDAKPGEPHFSEVPHPRAEIERLLAGPLASRDGLVTLALAILGPHYATLDVCRHDLRLARELGLVASLHQGGGPARSPGGWATLIGEGLVGPGLNIVHGNDLADDELSRFVDLGASFSVTPENEMTQGHGVPITGRLLRLGAAPSLGVDLESVISGDMLTVARMALGAQRMADNAEARRSVGAIPATTTVTTREALRWATVEGARALGLEREVGSITPGKRADLVVIRVDLNLQPVHDPVSTVVMQAGLANIEHVLVEGRFRKRDGQLLRDDLPEKVAALASSGGRIARELGLATATGATAMGATAMGGGAA